MPRVYTHRSLCTVWLKFFLDLCSLNLLSAIQSFQNRTKQQFCLVLAAIANEAIVDMLTVSSAIDFGFPVMVIEFGEVDHLVVAVPGNVLIDLEHDFGGPRRER